MLQAEGCKQATNTALQILTYHTAVTFSLFLAPWTLQSPVQKLLKTQSRDSAHRMQFFRTAATAGANPQLLGPSGTVTPTTL